MQFHGNPIQGQCKKPHTQYILRVQFDGKSISADLPDPLKEIARRVFHNTKLVNAWYRAIHTPLRCFHNFLLNTHFCTQNSLYVAAIYNTYIHKYNFRIHIFMRSIKKCLQPKISIKHETLHFINTLVYIRPLNV